MTFENKIKRHTDNIDELRGKIAQYLEDELVAVVHNMSMQFPDAVVTACSAMGTWTLERRFPPDEFGQSDEFECMPEYLDRAFETIADDYGWGAIPIILVRAQAGKILERLKDW